MTIRPIDLAGRGDLARYARIYLSPHLDDAALSCGGAIAASPEQTLVITICTASPPPGTVFNPVAVEFHAEWGLAPDDVLRVRLAEDATAMAVLGVDYAYAGQLDAIYRVPEAYSSRATLYRPPVADDPLLPQVRDLIALLIERAPHATIYVPLGVGHHVDHLVVFEAASTFPLDRLAFYEDINYALTPGAVERRLANIGKRLIASLVLFDTSALQAKIAAIAAYHSQMDALFGGAAAMEAAITDYHAALAQNLNGYAERIWRIE